MNQIANRSQISLPKLENHQAEASRLRRLMQDKATPDELLDAAKMLMAPYPNLKPADPQGYVKTMMVHLSKYPLFVIHEIIDPRSGVVTICTFPPVIAEVENFAKPILNEMLRSLEQVDNSIKQLTTPIKPEVSEIDQAKIAAGLRALAKSLAGFHDMEKASRPRPRANQCIAGDAIRQKEGWDKLDSQDISKTIHQAKTIRQERQA